MEHLFTGVGEIDVKSLLSKATSEDFDFPTHSYQAFDSRALFHLVPVRLTLLDNLLSAKEIEPGGLQEYPATGSKISLSWKIITGNVTPPTFDNLAGAVHP
jgi:hypothetical protein